MSKRHVDNLTEEQIELNKQWIVELRSGKHKQARGALAVKLEDGTLSYCCLGIAACWVLGEELIDETHDLAKSIAIPVLKRNPGEVSRFFAQVEESPTSLLTYEMRDKLGLTGTAGSSTDNSDGWSFPLASLNDNLGISFEEIANEIEKSLQECGVNV